MRQIHIAALGVLLGSILVSSTSAATGWTYTATPSYCYSVSAQQTDTATPDYAFLQANPSSGGCTWTIGARVNNVSYTVAVYTYVKPSPLWCAPELPTISVISNSTPYPEFYVAWPQEDGIVDYMGNAWHSCSLYYVHFVDGTPETTSPQLLPYGPQQTPSPVAQCVVQFRDPLHYAWTEMNTTVVYHGWADWYGGPATFTSRWDIYMYDGTRSAVPMLVDTSGYWTEDREWGNWDLLEGEHPNGCVATGWSYRPSFDPDNCPDAVLYIKNPNYPRYTYLPANLYVRTSAAASSTVVTNLSTGGSYGLVVTAANSIHVLYPGVQYPYSGVLDRVVAADGTLGSPLVHTTTPYSADRLLDAVAKPTGGGDSFDMLLSDTNSTFVMRSRAGIDSLDAIDYVGSQTLSRGFGTSFTGDGNAALFLIHGQGFKFLTK